MRLKRTWLVCVLALACASPLARAELWVYVDEQGNAHFSPNQIDERYRLFYKGSTNLDIVPAPTPVPPDFAGAAQIIRDRVDGNPNVAKFMPLIERQAKAHGLEPALLKALVAVESAFDPRAVSPKGAIGLMQVIPDTAARYGLVADAKRTLEQKLMDPATNVRIGTRYLADLLKRFGNDLSLALAGYNAGEFAVERYGRIPPFPETQAYVVLVQKFRDLYAPPPPPPPKPSRVVIPRKRAP